MATENLLRYRGKTVAIFVPLLVVIFFAAAMTFVRDGLRRDAELSVSMCPDVTVQRFVGGRTERVDAELVRQLEGIKNVERLATRIWGYIPAAYRGGTITYTIMGLDLEKVPEEITTTLVIDEGRFLEKGDRGKAIIGRAFAQTFGVELNDTLLLPSASGENTSFEIIGIFSGAVQIYAADLLLTSLEDAREFFGYEVDEATDICVYCTSPIYADGVAYEISVNNPTLRTLTREGLRNLVLQAYSGRSGVFQLIWLILLITALLIAWGEASNISLDMRREIGIFKAVGWKTMEVIEVKLLESVILGSVATLAGLFLGLLYLRLGAPVLKSFFLGWSTVFPEFPIPIHISYKSVVMLFVIAIFPLLVATVIPAWRTGIIEPDRAIRGT